MRRFFSLCLSLMTLLALQAAGVTYVADNTTNFCNPERGYYHMIEVHMNQKGGGALSDGSFSGVRQDGRTLVMRHYYMEPYCEGKAIVAADLQMITNDMAVFRRNGVKAILRFSYGSKHNSDTDFSHDASEQTMYAHMAQLKPILAANADVIACVQAGFIGVWGEWYYSSNFGINCGGNTNPAAATAIRNRVITHLLDMVPADRCLQLRTPQYMAEYIGNGKADYATVLTDQTAFSGSDLSRIGHHNDAFCNGADNLGTYQNVSVQKAYLAAIGKYVPMGGETCLGTWASNFQSTYNNYNNGQKSAAEMEMLHYDYLNMAYSTDVLNRWKQEYQDGMSWYDIIARRMGYRYQLVSAFFSDVVAPGETMQVNMTIDNKGYSTLYNRRIAYIVLKNDQHTYLLPLQSDPRLWHAGQQTLIAENLPISSDILPGNYHLYLYLPDAYASLATNPDFAVRLANKNIWEAATGYNDLCASILISGSYTPSEMVFDSELSGVTNASAVLQGGDVRLSWVNPASQGGDGPAQEVINLAQARVVGEASTSLANGELTVNYNISSAWGAAGVDFALDNRSDIESFSFDFRGCGATLWTSFFPFLQDDGYRWVNYPTGDYSLGDTEWQRITDVPFAALWNDNPSHAFGDHPFNAVGFLANPSAASQGFFMIRNVVLNLIPTQGLGLQQIIIVRKEGSDPANLSDGIVVFVGSAEEAVDATALPGKTYHYGIFLQDSKGHYAQPTYVTCTTPTALLDLELPSSPRKLLRNGQIVILRDGAVYSITGHRLE